MRNRIWMLLIAAVLTFGLANPTLAAGAAVQTGEKALAALDTDALGPAGAALPSDIRIKPDTLGDKMQIAQRGKKNRRSDCPTGQEESEEKVLQEASQEALQETRRG